MDRIDVPENGEGSIEEGYAVSLLSGREPNFVVVVVVLGWFGVFFLANAMVLP